MNLSHPQLSPSVNRTRREPGGVATPERADAGIKQLPVDPQNPYRMTNAGLHRGAVRDEAGAERPFVLYIPETMKTSGNSMIVFIPGGEDPAAYFRSYKWKENLEKRAISTYFISAPGGWKTDDPGFEMDVATKVLAELRSLEYYPSNAPGVYCMGFGDGANIASVFAIIHITVLAAWAAWGDTQLDSRLIGQIGGAPSDCDAGLKKSDIPLPTFIIDENESNTLKFFIDACGADNHYLCDGNTRVYHQRAKPRDCLLNDPVCSEVRSTGAAAAEEAGYDVMIGKMAEFVENYKRWGREGNGDIRNTQRPDDIGLIKTEAVIDGLKRYWYTFEPTAYKRGMREKYPLVVAIHGFSCSGEFFAENSLWHCVGEERGAIIVYPSAYPHPRVLSAMPNGRSGLDSAATPSWNSGGINLETEPHGPDDVSFFRQMLAAVEARYPIDPGRIYVTGHSNGSMMTQRLMRFWPEKFAGFAPVGGMEGMRGDTIPEPDDGYQRNVWYVMGEYDRSGAYLEEGGANYRAVNNLCAANKIDYARRKYYESGIYWNTIIRDDDKVPLVRFTGIRNWPHTYTPELAFMIYDEFFARFIRHPDGRLEYLA